MIEVEIEWVVWIHIDQYQIGVTHRELPKSELVSAIRHVIRCRESPVSRFRHITKSLDDLPRTNLHRCNTSFDMRGWQNLARIQHQVILLHLDSPNFARLNQICEVNAQKIHESLHGQMQRLNFVGVQKNLAIRSGAQRAVGFERNVPFAVELAFNFQVAAAIDANRYVFERSISACEYV